MLYLQTGAEGFHVRLIGKDGEEEEEEEEEE